MYRAMAFLTIAGFLVGCADNDGPLLPPSGYTISFESIAITDDEILQLVYSPFKLPENFYQEDIGHAGIDYENTLSILPLQDRTPHVFELSTNSHDQALAWSESSSVHSSYYRTIESETETYRYFQFRRVYQEHPADVLLSRVHKLSYLDRSMADIANPTTLIGVLNLRPVNDSSVTALAQYFWFIRNSNTGGAKALGTAARQTADTVHCALYEIQVTYGDYGVRDYIRLIRKQYSVSVPTGEIRLTESVIRTVERQIQLRHF